MKRNNNTGIAWSFVVVIIVLVVASAAIIISIHPADWASALGSIIGGVIGFLGAAASVYFLFGRQVQDEANRIYEAIVREVAEFSRIAVGNLDICEKIKNKEVSIPPTDLPEIMVAATPTIYPAVADRIGRLHRPQDVVAFYNRIAEADRMVRVIARLAERLPVACSGDPPPIEPEVLENLVDIWVNVCQLAANIIDHGSSALTDDQAIMIFRKHISEALERARRCPLK